MIHYLKTGSGPTIVFIHGFGEDSRIWNQQVDDLKINYQMITPDLRGSGNSSSFAPPATIEQMADDILEILNAEAINICTLIGHSMGGYITLALVEKNPERFNGFALIHSTSYADTEEKKEARRKSMEFIQQNAAHDFIKATIPNLFGSKFKQQFPEQVQNVIDQGKQFSKETLISYYQCMINRPDRTSLLKNTPLPVLHVIGSEDKAVNPADALQQAALPAICLLLFIQEVAHMSILEAPDMVNAAIKSFLQLISDEKS